MMSIRSFLLWILCLVSGCATAPMLRVNHCNYQANFGLPKTQVNTLVDERLFYTDTWQQHGFSFFKRPDIDLGKSSKQHSFTCKRISVIQIKLFKTWQDALLSLIPFYYSTHIKIYYLPVE